MSLNQFIIGNNIDDCWRAVLWHCVKNGYDFVLKGGSYVGQIRKQLDRLALVVTEPWTRPLAPIMPRGLPPVTTDEKIEKYFLEYLMSADKKENEDYTYGSYIAPQLVPRSSSRFDKWKPIKPAAPVTSTLFDVLRSEFNVFLRKTVRRSMFKVRKTVQGSTFYVQS